MSNPPSGDLQFDRVEPSGSASGGQNCTICREPLRDSYYTLNGQAVCPSCRAKVESHLAGGSFVKALGLGLGAALLGAGLYFAIELLTGYELGLVAVVVGYLVGTAVRKGWRGAGGWRPPALAVALTYLAIVATDSSMFVRQIIQESNAKADSAQTGVQDTAGQRALAPTGSASGNQTQSASEDSGTGSMALLKLLGIFLVSPVLIGMNSPLHLLIAGIALYEAWKLSRSPVLIVGGPFQLAGTP